jgi:hypothetical protein
MKLERSNIDFPLWRKKVDKSLFEHNGTTIPVWACEMWGLPSLFSEIASRKDKKSEVLVEFNKSQYQGWVTTSKHGRNSAAYRLWFVEELSLVLKRTFLMSYMRALETGLSPLKVAEVEKQIPFWEFLDIEFDYSNKFFKFVAYYTQEPSFPSLFSRLIGSPSIARVDDEVHSKKGHRIHKQDWKPKEDLEYEIGATNVIYILADTNNKLLYIGEAKDLVKRLSQKYICIPKWNFFRYDILPEHLESLRVPLERMTIRGFASILENRRNVPSILISDYKLANDKIDK